MRSMKNFKGAKMQENELQQVTGGFGMFGEHNPIFGKPRAQDDTSLAGKPRGKDDTTLFGRPRSKDDTTLFGKPRVKGEGSLGEASDA
jgi:bacteriocin-like protein